MMTNLTLPTVPLPAGPAAVARPLRPTQPVDPAKLLKTARDFEAMAIGELLKPMFDTVDSSAGPFGGGVGEQTWKPMMVQEYAKNIAANGGLGLAKSVYEAMVRMQENSKK